MHYALPPKKSSFPPPYARISAKSNIDQRRKRLQVIGSAILGVIAIFWLVRWIGSVPILKHDGGIPSSSNVLIVTVTDEKTMGTEHLKMMKTNRDAYAARHGYKTFFTDVSAYTHLTSPSPSSWALIPALRHALTLYPEVDYIWSLSPHALIMNHANSLDTHVFSRLSGLMLKDIPVVPPDSVIHTFSHLNPNQAYLIISQDIDNLAHTSFLLRNTPAMPSFHDKTLDSWSQFFLDAWFDPLYRTYAFQKAENHALEHLVQWHPTVLARLVIVDQRILNSYNHQAPTIVDPDRKEPRNHDSMYQAGDLIVNFKGCKEQEQRDCEKEMREYYDRWQTQTEKDGSKRGKSPSLVEQDALPVGHLAADVLAEQQRERKVHSDQHD